MNRNLLYLVIGALVIATLALGYYFYQERQKTSSIEINVGKSGITVETK
jgi:RsiW-degrading membrane proteinase PrsW (M82 family)